MKAARSFTWLYGDGYLGRCAPHAGLEIQESLKVLDEVAASRTPVMVTKRGKPVAIVMPYTTPRAAMSSLAGSVLKESGSPFGTHETWDADPS